MAPKAGSPCPECKAGQLVLGFPQAQTFRVRFRKTPFGMWSFSGRPLEALACESCGYVTLRLGQG